MSSSQTQESGNNEWYTPMEYIESARIVLGTINLDPASNTLSQSYIKADRFYDKDNDGLLKQWEGNVFMNPPYSRKLLSPFVDKLIQSQKVNNYICLVNASTDTSWCHKLLEDSDGMCLTRGRISFVNENGIKVKGNSRGQIFFYKGSDYQTFNEHFTKYGKVIPL